jgi:predicted N-acetyltransferase YhbS
MTARLRQYEHEHDFMRIRDLLASTYQAFELPLNWRIERWNYARYFAAPYLGIYEHKEPNREESLKAIRFWEEAIGVWESNAGEIVGVVNIEHPVDWHPELGEVFLQRHPQHTDLLGEMLDYAEENLVDRKTNSLHLYIHDRDEELRSLVRERGYEKDGDDPAYVSEFIIEDLPGPNLPEGFSLQSMADENNIELRREIFGRGFNHPDPSEWPSVFAYEELQRAPDYRKDLDLYIVGPEGNHVACCIIWHDAHNRIGILEPVCTHPDFRRRGLGREVMMEAIRRVAALDAEKVVVGSGQHFYEAIGFEKKHVSHRWTKRL